jgi:hypothetical protein
MRKVIMMAIAAFVWKKVQARMSAPSRTPTAGPMASRPGRGGHGG